MKAVDFFGRESGDFLEHGMGAGSEGLCWHLIGIGPGELHREGWSEPVGGLGGVGVAEGDQCLAVLDLGVVGRSVSRGHRAGRHSDGVKPGPAPRQ